MPSARVVTFDSPQALWFVRGVFAGCVFRNERGGGLTGQPVGPEGETATITIVMSTNHVDSGSFSSRCCAFRRTHASEDPYLATLYPTSFTPESLNVLTICTQRNSHGLCLPRLLWFVGNFSCDCIFRDEMGGRLTGQPVGPQVDVASITPASTNCVESGSFSSKRCAFRRTHTSAEPIRLGCIRLALPLTLSLPSRFALSARLVACVSPRAL